MRLSLSLGWGCARLFPSTGDRHWGHPCWPASGSLRLPEVHGNQAQLQIPQAYPRTDSDERCCTAPLAAAAALPSSPSAKGPLPARPLRSWRSPRLPPPANSPAAKRASGRAESSTTQRPLNCANAAAEWRPRLAHKAELLPHALRGPAALACSSVDPGVRVELVPAHALRRVHGQQPAHHVARLGAHVGREGWVDAPVEREQACVNP